MQTQKVFYTRGPRINGMDVIGGGCNCGPRNCDHTFSMKSGGQSLAKAAAKAATAEKKEGKKKGRGPRPQAAGAAMPKSVAKG